MKQEPMSSNRKAGQPAPSSRGRRITTTTLLTLTCLTAGATEMYLWRDKHGKAHFSERPPQDVDAVEVSGSLRDANFLVIEDPGPVEFYRAPAEQRGRARVDVRIQYYDYVIDPRRNTEIREHIEAIYDIYAKWFGWSTHPERPINIRIFGNYADFERFQTEEGYRYPMNRSHYAPARREVVMIGTEWENKTIRVLYHEASHAIMHMQMHLTPKWLNEGLAEVFELIETSGADSFRLGYHVATVAFLKQKLREGSLESARAYFEISNADWRDSAHRVENMYYRVAWSLMRYMTTTEHGRKALRDTLQAIRDDPQWDDGKLPHLIDEHYPGGLERLNRDWRLWIGRL